MSDLQEKVNKMADMVLKSVLKTAFETYSRLSEDEREGVLASYALGFLEAGCVLANRIGVTKEELLAKFPEMWDNAANRVVFHEQSEMN